MRWERSNYGATLNFQVMAKCAHMLLGSRERTSQKPSELSETWDGNSDCTASRTIEIFQCSATRYKKANQAPEWHEYVSMRTRFTLLGPNDLRNTRGRGMQELNICLPFGRRISPSLYINLLSFVHWLLYTGASTDIGQVI